MRTMAQSYLDQTAWTRVRLAAVRDLVEPRPGERILDLGCAAGAVTHFLSTFGAEPVGVDAEELAVETARSLFPALSFELADVRELPFEDESFDKAVAADLVEHLEDEVFAAMLADVRRVLRPGGTLSVYTPNPAHPIERLKARDVLLAQNPTHIGLRTSDQLVKALERNGFKIDLAGWTPSFFPLLRTIERLLGRFSQTFRYRLCIRASS